MTDFYFKIIYYCVRKPKLSDFLNDGIYSPRDIPPSLG